MRKKIIGALAALFVLAGVGWILLWADSGANHQVFLVRPIPCGVSGGNINDRSKAFCCGGTLGSLVADDAAQYILSNNHVLARGNKATPGDDVIQPGLIDQNPACFQDPNDGVADLTAFVRISFKTGTTNRVDAAIAQVRAGAVDSTGTILDIGQVAAGGGVAPALGIAVAKSGRTTGSTQGVIAAVNVTVDVKYDTRCGGGGGIARFVGQVRIRDAAGGTPAPFSAGGDSGSLIVQDGVACRGAVGLLFAGSSTDTIANSIGDVLSSFGVGMVGAACTPSSGSTTASSSTSSFPAGASQRQIAAIAIASDVKERHSEALFAIPGVIGHGVGLAETDPEGVVIEVYVEAATDKLRRQIPSALEGIPVRIAVTGPIVAF